MLDIKFVRENAKLVKKAAHDKNTKVDVDKILVLDQKKRDLQAKIELLRADRNIIVGELKNPKAAGFKEKITKAKKVKEMLHDLEPQLVEVSEELFELSLKLPNIPSKDTPIGPDAQSNKVIKKVGKLPKFSFKPKEHWQLGEKLDILDMERGAKVSGTRFGYLKGKLAMLEFAIVQYAFSVLTDEKILAKIIKENKLKVEPKPFIPIVPPVMIKPDVYNKMARLEPKEERYHIPSDDLYLIGSAEHTLGAMHMDEILDGKDLPIRYVGFSTAFRREAGTYGKDMKGILRVHQFDKVEMESFVLPKKSLEEQNFFVAIQEYLMQSLEIPYQVVSICTGDMGAPDARQIDIEAWMPGQNKYRETHTADLMNDFQSRRLNTRVKTAKGHEFVHMNDATVFALSRTPVAIMENYQEKDGSIKVPKVLQKYCNFTEIK
ncbi:MAG: serine--tRNA ligase [Patescibacteria group bacterium]|nr:serine--tRNA ligase [Patescibacteria group bacterium]